MTRKKRRESEICDKADLPSGYVPLGTLATDGGATPLYGYVQRAYERGQWTRSLFRCRGKRFIHKDDLDRLTAEFNSKPAACVQEPPREPAKENGKSSAQLEALLCALSALITNQTTMLHSFERIAYAVEKIAKHPLARLDDVCIVETEDSWKETNGQPH